MSDHELTRSSRTNWDSLPALKATSVYSRRSIRHFHNNSTITSWCWLINEMHAVTAALTVLRSAALNHISREPNRKQECCYFVSFDGVRVGSVCIKSTNTVSEAVNSFDHPSTCSSSTHVAIFVISYSPIACNTEVKHIESIVEINIQQHVLLTSSWEKNRAKDKRLQVRE